MMTQLSQSLNDFHIINAKLSKHFCRKFFGTFKSVMDKTLGEQKQACVNAIIGIHKIVCVHR